MFQVDTANALYSTVTNVAQPIATDLETGRLYQFVSTITCWIAQGATPTASAAAGSKFCAAGESVIINGGHGVGLSVIREGGSNGAASLTPVDKVR